MRVVLSLIVSLAALLTSVSAGAHHSFSAEFDVGRPVNLTGAVTKIEWTNPHAWVFLDVEDDSGQVQNWAVEMLGVNALVRSGMSPKTVKPGIVLTITGFGSRDGTNAANASSVKNTATGESLWTSAREDRD